MRQNVLSILHVFHHIFRAMNHHYPLESRMLTHDSAHPVRSNHELEGEGAITHRMVAKVAE